MPRKNSILDEMFSPNADRKAINANADELAVAEADIVSLREQVAVQARHLDKLTTLVMALSHALQAKGTVTQADLDEAVDTVGHAQPATDVDEGAYRSAPAAAADRANDPRRASPRALGSVTCVLCHLKVPARTTFITPAGSVCEPCHTL